MFFNEAFGGVIPGARGSVLAVLLRTDAPLTGRQVHALVSSDFSLWRVQQELKDLAALGMTTTETVGRAGIHRINEHHAAIAPLRAILDPISLLGDVARAAAGSDVEAVIVFGSVARGQAMRDSDVDLAIVADPDWHQEIDVADAVRTRLGNTCDVLHLTPEQFTTADREPVIAEILRDGLVLAGRLPQSTRRMVS